MRQVKPSQVKPSTCVMKSPCESSQLFSCVCYSKAGITEVFEGHHGPVTGLSCHSAGGPVDFSHLFISSSFDWTVKLWSTKVRHLQSQLDAHNYSWFLTFNPFLPLPFCTEYPPIVLVRGQLRLCLWCDVVSNTPCSVCLCGPSWTLGPVEPQQWYRSMHTHIALTPETMKIKE